MIWPKTRYRLRAYTFGVFKMLGVLKRLVFSVIAAVALNSCAPIPHTIHLVHPITITVKSYSEKPTRVLVSRQGVPCEKSDRTALVTNNEKRDIEGVSVKTLWLVLVPFDPITGFNLCLEIEGKKYFGVNYVHMGYSSDKVDVHCGVTEQDYPYSDSSRTVYDEPSQNLCQVTKG
jgi:hypothetical protein